MICTSSQVGTVFGVFANTGMWRDIDANTRYFAATNTYIRGDFLRFYDETGGLDRHGFPRTNAGPENGVTTQWFQRSRFEASSDVRLAFLGDEFVRALGLGWDLDTSQECEIRNSPPPMVGSLAGPEPLGIVGRNRGGRTPPIATSHSRGPTFDRRSPTSVFSGSGPFVLRDRRSSFSTLAVVRVRLETR